MSESNSKAKYEGNVQGHTRSVVANDDIIYPLDQDGIQRHIHWLLACLVQGQPGRLKCITGDDLARKEGCPVSHAKGTGWCAIDTRQVQQRIGSVVGRVEKPDFFPDPWLGGGERVRREMRGGIHL
jgi:hypothetical protein